jgi:hypothetical protein
MHKDDVRGPPGSATRARARGVEPDFHELEPDRGLAAANRVAPGWGVNLPDTRELACKSPTTLVER